MGHIIFGGAGAGAGSSGISFGDAEERAIKTLFFYDDFADADPKVIGVTATTAEISNDAGTEGTIMAFSGGKMLKVQDASAVTNQVYYKFGRFADGKIGIKLRWWKNSDTASFEIKIDHYDKTTIEEYGIKFLESGMKWQYYNSAGAWADVTSGGEDIADNTWNELHLIIDLTNVKYSQLITNGLNVDLSTISADTTADAATEGHTYIAFGTTAGANDKATYLDEFKIYLNET